MADVYECYDEWWLPKDMENMGFIFEYCDLYCRDAYGAEIEKISFLEAFMKSKLREEMETGHPQLLSESARDTVEKFIEVDCDSDIDRFLTDTDVNKEYAHDQFYWIGWMYAYLHFRSKLPSSGIVRILSVKDMLQQYYLGHEMDKETYYRSIHDRLSGGFQRFKEDDIKWKRDNRA